MPVDDASASTLVIRLGAMGDIIHALPAVASLKNSFPASKLVWLAASKWMPLLEGNPFIDELMPFDRSPFDRLRKSWQSLRKLRPTLALDFQGLLQSALAGRIAHAGQLFGFDGSVAREPFASVFYTHRVPVVGPHRIERNLQLVAAAGAYRLTRAAWIPPGHPEAGLPSGPFVLVSPFAGWKSKEWPLERYEQLAQLLNKEDLELVANVPTDRAPELSHFEHVRVHTSSLAGLIYATRRANAIIGLDSGPLHLAAALQKPGVALFGPTDPALTGPYGGSMTVLRAKHAGTTYKRHRSIHSSMREITAEETADALMRSIHASAGHMRDAPCGAAP